MAQRQLSINQSESNVGFRHRLRLDVFLFPVTDNRFAVDRARPRTGREPHFEQLLACNPAQRTEHLDLFIPNRIGTQIRRRFHRDQAEQLQQMILDHVTQCPRPFVIARTILNAELFTRCDLYMVDVAFVPEMFKERVSKTQDHDILSRFFAQKMVDPERARFVKAFVHRVVQVPGSR